MTESSPTTPTHSTAELCSVGGAHDYSAFGVCFNCGHSNPKKLKFQCITPDPQLPSTSSPYHLTIGTQSFDFYDLLKARGNPDAALEHALKKIMYAGERGSKSKHQDVKEAIWSLNRWLELNP